MKSYAVSISDNLKALQDACAGHVPCVKTWHVKQISQILISQFDHYQKNCENFPSSIMLKKELSNLGYTYVHILW